MLSGCLAGPVGSPSSGAGIAVAVAPLSLPGVTNARYHLRVANASGDVVIDLDLTADRYGDGAGGVAYVAPCDADDNDNSVQLTLLDLYGGASGDVALPAASYDNPGALSRTITCLPDADVAVTFDLTIARAASQGFFDVAVAFDDVFCSAKLDCLGDPEDPTSLIELLYNGADRDTTFILGFACTGGLGTAESWQYLDDVLVSCDAGAVLVDAAAAPGTLAPSGITQLTGGVDPLFGAAVYRGTEQLSGFNKRYWNVALGFAGGTNCTLTTLGTASDGELTGHATPAGAVWPVIAWSVPLTDDAGAITCTQHPIGGPTCPAAGVCVRYARPGSEEAFDGAFGPSLPTGPCAPGSATFAATGEAQSFTVPAGCATVSVQLWGAGGGGSCGGGGYLYRTAGGGGGYTSGVLAVGSGEQLTVIVGQGGPGSNHVGFTPFGGGTPSLQASGGSGGGGGRSAIRRAGGVEVATAGAGGGGGYGNTESAPAVGGGASGGGPANASDGGPGTQVAGGAAGTGATWHGSAGAASQGGLGGDYCGGGGGYYGGGGASGTSGAQAGTGGGGSGYVGGLVAGVTSAGSGATPAGAGAAGYASGIGVGGAPGAVGTFETGEDGGHGLVIISWP